MQILTALMEYVAAPLLLLSILVVVHEYGHFAVARAYGVRVYDFAVGFGRILWSRRMPDGLLYSVRALPLGGYVRMADISDATHSATAKAAYGIGGKAPPTTFQAAPLHGRLAIALAGPFANLLFAFVVLWGVYTVGMSLPVPRVAAVIDATPAAHAGVRPGDLITAVNGRSIVKETDLAVALLDLAGYSGEIAIEVARGGDVPYTEVLHTDVQDWNRGIENLGLRKAFGVVTASRLVPARIGKVVPDAPADAAGVRAGDLVLSIDNTAVLDWRHLVDILAAVPVAPPQAVRWTVQREAEVVHLTVTPVARPDDTGSTRTFVGVQAAPFVVPNDATAEIRYPIYSAWIPAGQETWRLLSATVVSIGKMVSGAISPRHIAGPVGISQVTAQSLHAGWVSMVYLAVLLSISLGVVNLLPIPLLDGGRVVFEIVEAMLGRPLGAPTKAIYAYIGVSFIAVLMLFALYQDIRRW